MSLIDPKIVADAFVRALRRTLSDVEWDEMQRRNAQVQPGICHSHDFCDANIAMEEAFHSLGLATSADIGFDAFPEAYNAATDLWNEAWDLAMPQLGRKT